MKTFKKNTFFTAILLTLILQWCNSCNGIESFSPEELKLASPYNNDSTVIIYKSNTGLADTITFFKMKLDTIRFRSFEVGFYNETNLTVDYQLSENSYHKFIGLKRTSLIQIIRAEQLYPEQEFYFLGVLFNRDYLGKIMTTSDTTIVFNNKDALYKDVNINEPVNAFTFSTRNGIVSFMDKNNNVWARSN